MTKKLIILPDNSGWTTEFDNQNLIKVVKKLKIYHSVSKWGFNSNIYFSNRYQFLKWINFYSFFLNKGICDYYHGDPSISPEFKMCFDGMKKKRKHLSIIRVSHSGIKNLFLNNGFDEDKIFQIPIGIDIDHFPLQTKFSKKKIRKHLDLPQNAIIVGSFQKDGNGWGQGNNPKLIKGPDILIQTLKILKTKIPELFILLTGPSRGFLKNNLSKLNIPYKHYNLKNYYDINKYYDALDAYIVTSREEGGPKAVLESLAKGIRFISTPVGQAQDLIINGVNGWLAKSFSSEEITDLTLRALNTSAVAAIRYNGRKTAELNSYSNQLHLWKVFFKNIE